MNEWGYCPYCGTDLDGEDMVEAFVKQGKSLSEAHVYAMVYYGYREGTTKFGRVISLYDRESDRSFGCKCPDCNETW